MNQIYDLYTKEYLTNFKLIIDKLKVNMLVLQVNESTIILDYLGHKCLTIIIIYIFYSIF